MSTRTTRQLIYRALTDLGRLYVGDAPSDSDYDTVEELIEPVVDQLNGEDVVLVDDIDAIDTAIFLPLARILATEASGSFGNDAIQTLLTRNRAENVDALKERERQTIRRIVAERPLYKTLATEHF